MAAAGPIRPPAAGSVATVQGLAQPQESAVDYSPAPVRILARPAPAQDTHEATGHPNEVVTAEPAATPTQSCRVPASAGTRPGQNPNAPAFVPRVLPAAATAGQWTRASRDPGPATARHRPPAPTPRRPYAAPEPQMAAHAPSAEAQPAINRRIIDAYKYGKAPKTNVLKVTTAEICKAKRLDGAQACFDALVNAGIQPDVKIYSALISACAKILSGVISRFVLQSTLRMDLPVVGSSQVARIGKGWAPAWAVQLLARHASEQPGGPGAKPLASASVAHCGLMARASLRENHGGTAREPIGRILRDNRGHRAARQRSRQRPSAFGWYSFIKAVMRLRCAAASSVEKRGGGCSQPVSTRLRSTPTSTNDASCRMEFRLDRQPTRFLGSRRQR